MSGDVEALAEVLAGHAKECKSEACATCDCGWDLKPSAYIGYFDDGEVDHAAHVAAALLASDWMKRHDAEVRAGALREAAVEMDNPTRPKIVNHRGDEMLTGSRFIAAWLHARADREQP